MKRVATLIVTGALSASGALSARESRAWRQWGGPNRDFKVDAAGLAEAWPAAGPRTLWSRPLGTGTRQSSPRAGRRVGRGTPKSPRELKIG